MPRFPMSEWQVENMRLTVFPTDGTRSPEWWQGVTGSLPDEITIKKGVAMVQGAFAQGSLMLKWEIDRIDWILMPTDVAAGDAIAGGEFPSLGTFAEVLLPFSNAIEKWFSLTDVPAFRRIAFGCVLIHPEQSRSVAYTKLRDYIPVDLNPNSSDLLFQINLPNVESKVVNGLLLNRLSKWFVGTYSLAAPGVGFIGLPNIEVPVPLAMRVELDMNTHPKFITPMPKDRLVGLFHELIEHGHAIAAEGVIGK
jgi:hypothetical protein